MKFSKCFIATMVASLSLLSMPLTAFAWSRNYDDTLITTSDGWTTSTLQVTSYDTTTSVIHTFLVKDPGASREIIASYLDNGEFYDRCYYLFLDFGLFTDHMQKWKDAGYIDPAYQLPAKFYTIRDDTTKSYVIKNEVWGNRTIHPVVTDCPELQEVYNIEEQGTAIWQDESNGKYTRQEAYDLQQKLLPKPTAYIPKYLRDAGQATATWVRENGKWYYRLPNGNNITGIMKIDGIYYWFGETDGKLSCQYEQDTSGYWRAHEYKE